MSKETLHGLVDMIDEKEVDLVYKLLLKFIPEEPAEPNELKAILEAKADTSPTVSHEDLNWG